jgi:hypothetical protein
MTGALNACLVLLSGVKVFEFTRIQNQAHRILPNSYLHT